MQITGRLLKTYNACDLALRLVKPLLPIKFHINTESNLESAIKLINWYTNTTVKPRCKCHWCSSLPRVQRSLCEDLKWLLDTIGSQQKYNIPFILSAWPAEYDIIFSGNSRLDPLVVAQLMSWIADGFDAIRKNAKAR